MPACPSALLWTAPRAPPASRGRITGNQGAMLRFPAVPPVYSDCNLRNERGRSSVQGPVPSAHRGKSDCWCCKRERVEREIFLERGTAAALAGRVVSKAGVHCMVEEGGERKEREEGREGGRNKQRKTQQGRQRKREAEGAELPRPPSGSPGRVSRAPFSKGAARLK